MHPTDYTLLTNLAFRITLVFKGLGMPGRQSPRLKSRGDCFKERFSSRTPLSHQLGQSEIFYE